MLRLVRIEVVDGKMVKWFGDEFPPAEGPVRLRQEQERFRKLGRASFVSLEEVESYRDQE